MVNLPPPDSNDQSPAGQRRDNDEAIAITIALLSVGAILWWGWTRGQQLFGPVFNLPQLTADAVVTDDAQSALGTGGDGDSSLGGENRSLFSGLFAGGDGNVSAEADTDASAHSLNGSGSDSPFSRRDRTSETPSDTTGGDRSGAVGSQTTATDGVTADATPTPAEALPDGAATAPTDDSAVVPEPLPELSIADVSEDYWAYPYIASLFEAGLLPDLPSGQLQPDKELTRAELAALLNKSFVGAVPPKRSLTFTDVPGDFWAAKDIKQVVEAGYMTGFPEGVFRPDELVPRYQVFVTMSTGLELPPPSDVEGTIGQFQNIQNLPAWARPKVAAAAAQGLVVNHPDPQQLESQQPATRAELIAIIHQALVARGELAPLETPFAIPAE